MIFENEVYGFSTKDDQILSEVELKKLACDRNLVSNYKQIQLEINAQKNWDLFYKRNSTKFFKDRHWTTREFDEITSEKLNDKKLLEVGCGCGNAIFPLIEENKNIFVYACDFSSRAIEYVKAHKLYELSRCLAFQSDVTKDNLCSFVPEASIDIALMIFVLSAVHPDKMKEVLQNVHRVLKPGGIVLFRDYGLYDHAMLRFGPGHKLDDRFYVRQDGTRAYYFSTDKLFELFTSCGYEVVENTYIHRRTINKKEGIDVPRIFVQGKFTKLS
uniref:tRNA N(3)-methylcytidine methyltransferase n=1 Tax=Hydra vulgaris TaxID=6087 RepID=T2M8X2_HYDVU